MRLEGKVALVTGAAGGIGAATCERLAGEGARVAAADLDGARADDVASGLDGIGVELDVRSTDSAAAAVATAVEQLGPIDVLVNNAGIAEDDFFLRTDPEMWDRVIAVNLRGVLAVTHAVLPAMHERGSGSIVNVASEAGRVGSQLSTVYSATKAGVIGFTKALAKESARYGVRVNAVAPGPIDTPMLRVAPRRARPARRALRARDGRVHRDEAPGESRGGRGRDRLPRVRGRLVHHRRDRRRERRPRHDVSPLAPSGTVAGVVRGPTVVATLVTLSAFVGAGCGGDEALSADDYRAQTSEVCSEALERTMAVEPPDSPEALGGFLEEVVEIGGDLQDDFEGLEPPDDLADQHDDLVALGQEQEETLESLIDEIEQSDDPAATFTERIPELNDQVEESNQIVDEIGGIEECKGEPIPAPGDAPA
jgi:2-hydroxycyclohexanecarboxyl-CoA dehydrogenase